MPRPPIYCNASCRRQLDAPAVTVEGRCRGSDLSRRGGESHVHIFSAQSALGEPDRIRGGCPWTHARLAWSSRRSRWPPCAARATNRYAEPDRGVPPDGLRVGPDRHRRVGDLAGTVAATPGSGHRLRRDPGVERAHRRLEVGPSPRHDHARINGYDRQTVWRSSLISARLRLDSRLEAARAALDRSALNLATPC